jgi:putative ABC transport system permease protein
MIPEPAARLGVPTARALARNTLSREGTVVLQDLRFAWRGLRRNPGFAVVAVITLGLGIGANTAVFGVLNGVALRQLPYGEPQRLTQVRARHQVSLAVFEALRERERAFEGLSAYTTRRATLVGNGDPLVVAAGAVSAEHFDVLGRQPALGRAFLPDDHDPASAVVILGHALWQQRFGGDPSILGRTIDLRDDFGDRRTVIGVMPPDHRPLIEAWQVWVPHAYDRSKPEWQDMADLTLVGRLASGTTLTQARDDVRRVARELHASMPDHFGSRMRDSLRVIPLREALVADVRPTLWILQGCMALVLLIACANVANLLLARSTARTGEIALRTALGAGRSRLVRLMLTESAVIGVLGGALGLGLAWAAFAFVHGRLGGVPRAAEVGVDPTVVGFAVAFALLSAAVFGLAPALRAASGNLDAALRGGGAARTTSGSRLGSAIVAAEIALAVVLVAAAGLMSKSLWRIHQVPLGFEHERLLTLRLVPPPGRYGDDGSRRDYYRRVREQVAALPGVEACETVNLLPMAGGSLGLAYLAEGQPPAAAGDFTFASYRTVSSGYFGAMGVPLVHGRSFEDADRAGGREVGILNRTMAEHLWPGEDPVGKEIRWDAENPWFTVVGVVEDVRQDGLDGAPFDVIYRPYAQESWVQDLHFVVRAERDPGALAPSVRRAILAVDPEVPVTAVRTMDAVVDASLRSRNAITALLGAAAALALLLGSVGVYGVTSYAVGRRRREIGIRVAVGATRGDVMRQVLGRNVGVALAGLAVGLVGAVLASRALAGMLFEVRGTDLGVLAAVSASLLAAAAVASWVPARRAAATDPVAVLRRE